MRKQIGVELAQESPAPADLVVPVPDSGVPAAIGYAQESGLPFELGIIRSHYVGRTFIQPSDGARNAGVKRKHNANRAIVEGKRIVLIDDSIVRGTTSLKIIEMMRDAGAAEVHMRIASPPTEHSCFYGVDTPERSKLLAANMEVAAMAEFIKADSLAFVSIDGLYRAVGEAGRNAACPQFCDACFIGEYPTAAYRLCRTQVARTADAAARRRDGQQGRVNDVKCRSLGKSPSSRAQAAASARPPPWRSPQAGAHVVLTGARCQSAGGGRRAASMKLAAPPPSRRSIWPSRTASPGLRPQSRSAGESSTCWSSMLRCCRSSAPSQTSIRARSTRR